MNFKKALAVGTVACMVALTGCSANVPENNQGNRNGMRLTESANRTATTKTRSANKWNGTNKRVKVTRNMTANPTVTHKTVAKPATRGTVNNSNLTTGKSGTLNRVSRNINRSRYNNGYNTRISNAEINTRARNSVENNYNYSGSTSSEAYRNSIANNANRLNRSTARKTRSNTTGRTIDNFTFNTGRNLNGDGKVVLNDGFYNNDRTVLAGSIVNGKSKSVNVKVSELNSLINSLEKLKATKTKSKTGVGVMTAQKRAYNTAKQNAAKTAKSKAAAQTRSSKTASFKPVNNHIVPNNPGGTVVNRSIGKNKTVTKVSRSYKPKNMHIVPSNPGGTVVNRYAAKSIIPKSTRGTKATRVTRSTNITPNTTRSANTARKYFSNTNGSTYSTPYYYSGTSQTRFAPSVIAKTVRKTPVRKIMTGALVRK